MLEHGVRKKTSQIAMLCFFAIFLIVSSSTSYATEKPNILVIWGDDIGIYNISFWNRGGMGYQTPHIDRIAHEGIAFTDYYGEQSCTAGRSSFITGQNGLRTGNTKVGLPGAPDGLKADDMTIAEALKNMGYVTGQFGKNHLGDRDEQLPTNHGFDEFYGFLYHLNAMQEPQNPDYPRSPEFLKKYGPRGVLHTFSDGKITDTGPLNIERMKTIDDDTIAHAIKFMDKAVAAKKPFFVWWNASRMHLYTYVKESLIGISGQGFYNDAMMEHDMHVGKLLNYLDEKGLADNTIVYYGTDNGPHGNAWPDAASTYYRSEKETNWEGAYRVPAFVRWPQGDWKGGRVLNGIVSALDWMPTLLAAAGDPDIKEKLLKGYRANGKNFKIHLDGFNQADYFAGKTDESPRKSFIYFNADAQIVAIRYDQSDYNTSSGSMAEVGKTSVGKESKKVHTTAWKVIYGEQRKNTLALWAEPFVWLRLPKIFNLRRDPFERADYDSNTYWNWYINHLFVFYKANDLIFEELKTYKEYPPSQRPDSFSIGNASERVYDDYGFGPGGSKGTGIKKK